MEDDMENQDFAAIGHQKLWSGLETGVLVADEIEAATSRGDDVRERLSCSSSRDGTGLQSVVPVLLSDGNGSVEIANIPTGSGIATVGAGDIPRILNFAYGGADCIMRLISLDAVNISVAIVANTADKHLHRLCPLWWIPTWRAAWPGRKRWRCSWNRLELPLWLSCRVTAALVVVPCLHLIPRSRRRS
jgi:hypothetical protein